jgi:HEAT repeat protein
MIRKMILTVKWVRTTLAPNLDRWITLCLLLVWLPALAAAQQPSETSVAVLVQQLKDPREDVRITAANALGKLGPEAKKAIPDLRGVLNDPRETVRVAAIHALNNILPHTTPQLIEALKDENSEMRAFAAVSLANLDQLPKDALEPLIQLEGHRTIRSRFGGPSFVADRC